MNLIDTHLPNIHMSVRLYDKGNLEKCLLERQTAQATYGIRFEGIRFEFPVLTVVERDIFFNDCICRQHWNAGRFEIGSDFS